MIDLQQKLTLNFRWSEVVESITATRDEIDNTPPDSLYSGIIMHAANMELVRELLNVEYSKRTGFPRDKVNVPITVTSWYRGPELERVICDKSYRRWVARSGRQVDDQSWAIYLAAKSHPLGTATDFNSRKFGHPRRVFDAIHASDIVYDELIIEFDSWVHLSTSKTPRMSAFGINSSGRYTV